VARNQKLNAWLKDVLAQEATPSAKADGSGERPHHVAESSPVAVAGG